MNFQDIIDNARRWADILNEDSERGGTISKAAINGAASVLRALADKITFLVEHKEAAERKIAELEHEHGGLVGEQSMLRRERDKLREELTKKTHDLQMARDTISAYSQTIHEMEQAAVSYSQQIDSLRVELRDADAAANKATEKLTTLEAAYNSLRAMWEQQRRTIAKYQERAARTAVIIDYKSDYVGRPGKRRWTLNDRGELVQVNGGANTIDSSHTHRPAHGGRPDAQATRVEGGEPSETAGMFVAEGPLTLLEIGRLIDLEQSNEHVSTGHIITKDGQSIPFCQFSVKVGGTD